MSAPDHHSDWAAALAGGFGGFAAPVEDFALRVLSGVVVALIVAFVNWAAKRLTARKERP